MPISSVYNFLSTIDKNKGPAMSDRFFVEFTLPSQLDFAYNVRDLTYQCETSELPGTSLVTGDYRTYGPARKFATLTGYNDITFSIYCTNAFWEKPLFDSWIDYINPRSLGWDFRFKDDYTTCITISQIDLNENIVYKVALNKAFPFNIAPLSLSWSSSNFHLLQVTFAYDNYQPMFNGPDVNPIQFSQPSFGNISPPAQSVNNPIPAQSPEPGSFDSLTKAQKDAIFNAPTGTTITFPIN